MNDFSRNSFRGSIWLLLPLLLFLAGPAPSFSDDFPWGKPDGYVTDRAGMLSLSAKENISAMIADLESKTDAEIAVATMDHLESGDIRSTAVSLFKQWGVGKKGKDNGILILLSKKERKVDIEIGYGMESVVTDGMAGEIIRNTMAPYFKTGDFDTGFYKAVEAIVVDIELSKGIPLKGGVQATPSEAPEKNNEKYGFLIFLVFFAIMFVISRLAGGGRGSGGMWYGGGWGGGGAITLTLVVADALLPLSSATPQVTVIGPGAAPAVESVAVGVTLLIDPALAL